ncbi:MAG: NAD(P)H-binding protein [Kofleriaceae bacterium]|nr:NAD(P)H-binding protein [Kofleriaceae bacterium]
MKQNKRIAFVAGSTGYVGQAVVAALRDRNLECIAHIRPQSSSAVRLQPHFESLGAKVDCVAWELDALSESLRAHKPSHVFCLIGTTRKQAAAEGMSDNIYERIDLRLTSMLIEAARNSGQSPRFVYLSSIGAKSGAKSKYLQARGRAEEMLQESGLPYVIARPSFITGSDRDEARPLERVTASLSDGALSLVSLFGAKKLKKKYQSTSGTEFAHRLVDLALGSEQGIFEGASLSGVSR